MGLWLPQLKHTRGNLLNVQCNCLHTAEYTARKTIFHA